VVKPKEEIEQELREKLSDAFEIDVLRFHDLSVEPRGFGRDGWRETPLAYLVLRSKDPSVDRLPPVQIDLEFRDGRGSVLLPITSQTVLLNSGSAKSRPLHDVKIKQTLDDRRAREGQLQLEITASAKGILPPLEKLLDVEVNSTRGLKLAGVQDLGLEIAALDTSGEQVEPECLRRWIVDYTIEPKSEPDRFVFPTPLDESVELAFHKFADADIVETQAVVSLPTPASPPDPRRWAAMLGGVLGALLIGMAGVIVFRRIRRSVQLAVYRLPDELTPFNLIALLERIRRDQHVRLSESESAAIGATIAELESEYFTSHEKPADPRALRRALDPWLARAANHRSPSVNGSH
jgi:hypothetical protein